MNTEGALQQMVNPFADIDIEPRVAVLQHDLFLKVLALLQGALGKQIGQWHIKLRLFVYSFIMEIF
jgi:hypothetical protein